MTNKEIARAFKLAGQLLELHDENPFKVRSFQNAAFKVERLPEALETMDAAAIAGIEGIGKSLQARILELNERGSFDELDELKSKTPEGILEILSIKGLGPKKVRTLWQELEIQSVGELLYACQENRLVTLKGFGEKTQEQVRHSIEYAQSNKGKFLYAVIEPLALQLLADLRQTSGIGSADWTGTLRRGCEIIETAEFVTVATTEKITAFLADHPLVAGQPVSTDGTMVRSSLAGRLPLVFHCCSEKAFGNTLLRTTGDEAHLARLSSAFNWNASLEGSEVEIYRTIGYAFPEPELREEIWETRQRPDTSKLITEADLRGILHNHSTWSDGTHSLEVMARYCQELGYEYLGICDHSRSAFYANGLSIERVAEQHKEIEALNKKLAPFRILKGIESDILTDGSLDYPDDILDTFDLVVASVHSVLKMDENKATARLIRAVEHPATTILGHPTGRLLLSRPGYPIDHRKVIDACAANDVIIELNANPYRLDIDWRWIPYALDKGVMISINPDAHRKEGYHDMHFGVRAARKGGLTKEMTFNALLLVELEKRL